jgi:hypothetical protein
MAIRSLDWPTRRYEGITIQVIDMINQFQLEYTFSFGAKSPKPTPERKDENFKNHADTVAVVFSHSAPEVVPLGEGRDALPVDGAVFFLLTGDKVLCCHLEHIHYIQTLQLCSRDIPAIPRLNLRAGIQ